MWGRDFSPGHRRKLSETSQGKRNPMYGKHHSLEARQKMSAARKGKSLSEETKRRMSEAHKGKKFSLEHCQKIGDAQRGEKNHNWGKFGEKASHWKGGRKLVDDYVFLLKPNHPNADCNGYVKEHRFVMSEVLGRPLDSNEVVHHINGIRDDNRKENLMPFPSHKEHMTYHRKIQKCQQLV